MRHGPVARREREEEGRDADRERADEREVTRQQRVVDRGDPDRDDHERREHRLGDEELRHPLDVAEDPATLGDHRRDRREVAVDEHDVGDGLRHLRARALRDREARRLQRGHVVDAVADHRHVAPVAAQRLDDAALPLRRDAPDDRERRARAGRARRRSSGSAAPSSGGLERRDAGVRRDRAHRRGRRRRRGRRSRRPARGGTRSSRASRLAAPRRAPRDRAAAAAAGRRRGRPGTAPSLTPKPTTRRPASWFARGDRGELAEREELRRAEHVADAADRLPAPAPAGEERDDLVDRLGGARAAPPRSPPASGSAPRTRPRSDRARRRAPPRVVPAAGSTSTRRSEAVVSVPVLSTQIVSTDASDSIAFSCCESAPSAGHPQRGGRVGDGDEQDQPLGDRASPSPRRRCRRRGRSRRPACGGRRSASRRAAPSRRAARRAAGRSSARAASADAGTRGPSPRSARRSSRHRPRRPRTSRIPRRRTSPTAPRRRPPARTAADSPVRIDSSSWSPALVSRKPSATTWSPGREPDEVALDDLATREAARGSPSRTTVARGATSAASSSSFCFARSSCQIPIPVFVTMIPRKSASRQSPKTSVRRPSASRIALNGVTCSPGRLPPSTGSPRARAARARRSAPLPPLRSGPRSPETRLTALRRAARHSGGTTLPFDWARPAISFWRSTVSAAIASSSQSRVSRTRSELSSSSSCLISGENSKHPAIANDSSGVSAGGGSISAEVSSTSRAKSAERPLDVLRLGGVVLVVDRLDAPGHERAALGQLEQPEAARRLRRRC